MQLTHVRLLVEDMDACRGFYRDDLGLVLTLDAGGGVYCELRAGRVLLGLYRRDLMGQMLGAALPSRTTPADAVALMFEVADVDAEYRRLKERGVEFLTEPKDHEVAFLRVAHLRDPEGNLIEINQPLRSA